MQRKPEINTTPLSPPTYSSPASFYHWPKPPGSQGQGIQADVVHRRLPPGLTAIRAGWEADLERQVKIPNTVTQIHIFLFPPWNVLHTEPSVTITLL